MTSRKINLGQTKEINNLGREVVASVVATVKFSDGRLSIVGDIGPSGRYGCGQIISVRSEIFSSPYTDEQLDMFFKIWEDWHLNDMRAGCEHQREMGWDKRKIDDTKETGWSIDMRTANLAGWVKEEDHPRGVLSKPCPVCGYKYGTQWLFEEVPVWVIEFINSL